MVDGLLRNSKGLLFQIERDANAIGHETRSRERATSSSHLLMLCLLLAWHSVLDYAPALNGNNGLDQTILLQLLLELLTVRLRFMLILTLQTLLISTTTLQDTKELLLMTQDYSTAHTFHYSKLEQSTLTHSNQKIGFKTRYGMVSKPIRSGDLLKVLEHLLLTTNKYYRRVQVANLM